MIAVGQPETELGRMSHAAFAKHYEALRRRREAGEIRQFESNWCAAQAQMEVRVRENGFTAGRWTYTWDHRNDRLRRLPASVSPSYPKQPTPYLPRVIRTPPALQGADEIPDWMGVQG